MKQEYTLTIYTENQVGLLNRIAIMFSRRKINIESMNTSPSEIEGIHRFNILINESEDVVRKIVRQIEKQVDVLKAYFNTNDTIIWQELALYKVEFVRSARIAIIKDSKGFHEKLKEFELAEPTQHIIDEPISDAEASSKVV